MEKALTVAKKIRSDFDKNWMEELQDNNLDKIFQTIYSLNYPIGILNKIVCYIIYAYDPESLWLDVQKDRIEVKQSIMGNLELSLKDKLVHDVLNNQNEDVDVAAINYLETLRTWKWRSIFDLLEHSARLSRLANREVKEELEWEELSKEGNKHAMKEDIDINNVLKAEKTKGELLSQAIEYRRKADDLMQEIKREFVQTDNATQQDLGFSFTDTASKKDIMSHRQYVYERNEKRRLLRQQ